jgi:hypothetical protein
MLWSIAVVLLILWLRGFSFHVGGALVQSYFGNRRDRGSNQARHRSRGVAFDCAGSPSQRLTKTSNQDALQTEREKAEKPVKNHDHVWRLLASASLN